MKVEVVCPDNCSGGTGKRQRTVSLRGAGITLDVARAAGLKPNDMLSKCGYCGCVWRQIPGLPFAIDRTDIFGQYDGMNSAGKFVPEPWLEKAIALLKSGE